MARGTHGCCVPSPTWCRFRSISSLSFVIVTLEHSDRYLAAAGATAVEMLVLVYGLFLPGIGPLRAVERWAAGDEVDAGTALEATYTWAVARSSADWRSSRCVGWYWRLSSVS